MKVILFGGSFNPPHLGHLKLALNSLKFLNASELWFIPSLKSPLKDIELAEYEHRCAMIEILIKPYRKLKLSRIEAELDEISYTYNTVDRLIHKYRDIEFIWLMGSDQANQFDKWYKYDELINLIQFAVYRRDKKDMIDTKFIEIKSNQTYDNASQKIRKGEVHLTHPHIVKYMMDNELYVESIAESMMSQKRYSHVKSTCELALALASAHDVDLHQVYMASLFHDCAKEWDRVKSIAWLSFIEPMYIEKNEALWHQKCAAGYAHRYLQINDKTILKAIAHHVNGSDDMVSRIVYIADKCERTRKYDSSEFINSAMVDINKAYELVKKAQVKWLEQEGVQIG
jgi:nicotinate-nucleotide adenylyltransferase